LEEFERAVVSRPLFVLEKKERWGDIPVEMANVFMLWKSFLEAEAQPSPIRHIVVSHQTKGFWHTSSTKMPIL
jgi:hypothetical protein